MIEICYKLIFLRAINRYNSITMSDIFHTGQRCGCMKGNLSIDTSDGGFRDVCSYGGYLCEGFPWIVKQQLANVAKPTPPIVVEHKPKLVIECAHSSGQSLTQGQDFYLKMCTACLALQ
jgi:hypothetical protein